MRIATSTPMNRYLLTSCLLLLAAALARAAGPDPAVQPLRFGAVGYAGSAVDRSVGLLAAYLETGLRRPVEVKLFERYPEIVAALKEGALDAAILPPVVFLIAEAESGVQPLANPIFQTTDTTYRGVILARGDDDRIVQLADLKGRKVAFVDEMSASGYIVPRGMLAQAGLAGGDAVEPVFTGNHVKSVEALLAGEVDAAATFDMLLAETPALGKSLADFTVLARSEPIPGETVVASKVLPAKTVVWLRSLLLAFAEKRRSDPKYGDCLYQWFFAYDPSRYLQLRRLWNAAR